MAGFRLPKLTVNEKLIDLSEYGGEGFLSVRAITTGDSWALNDYIKGLAKEDGIKCETDKDVGELSSGVYKFQAIMFTIMRLVSGVDGDARIPITEDDFMNLPPELLAKILSVIDEGAKFPLAQTAGMGQK